MVWILQKVCMACRCSALVNICVPEAFLHTAGHQQRVVNSARRFRTPERKLLAFTPQPDLNWSILLVSSRLSALELTDYLSVGVFPFHQSIFHSVEEVLLHFSGFCSCIWRETTEKKNQVCFPALHAKKKGSRVCQEYFWGKLSDKSTQQKQFKADTQRGSTFKIKLEAGEERTKTTKPVRS